MQWQVSISESISITRYYSFLANCAGLWRVLKPLVVALNIFPKAFATCAACLDGPDPTGWLGSRCSKARRQPLISCFSMFFSHRRALTTTSQDCQCQYFSKNVSRVIWHYVISHRIWRCIRYTIQYCQPKHEKTKNGSHVDTDTSCHWCCPPF